MRSERTGILLILGQQLLFTLDTAAIHRLAGSVSLWQLGLCRSIGGLGLALCLAPSIGWAAFRTHHPTLQALRAAVTVAYAWVLVNSFTVMPFADATAIGYTQAIYVALLAPPILGEVVGPRRLLAVFIGSVGALMVVKPGFSQASPIYLAVLAGTSLNALALVLTKYLQRQDSAVTVMLYLNVATIASFTPGISDPLPAVPLWPWLIATCVAGPLGMYVGILAVRYADASTLAPYTYVRLVLAVIGATLVFGEMPDLVSIAGVIGIVIACVVADRAAVASVLGWANASRSSRLKRSWF
jgi:drug/metabolite transporter (DMT)-like permease